MYTFEIAQTLNLYVSCNTYMYYLRLKCWKKFILPLKHHFIQKKQKN